MMVMKSAVSNAVESMIVEAQKRRFDQKCSDRQVKSYPAARYSRTASSGLFFPSECVE
jgi:hypothetical protein